MEEEMLIRRFAEISAWFEADHRILPWRSEPTDYYVWLSEIMLQQTRVEAVKPYFAAFIHRFPTIVDLGEAAEDDVLKQWEGLGYYSRARNLHKTAALVTAEYGGHLPADYEKILALPGIGSYTAGAIASIAYGLPYPAVDGNVLRVMTRLLGDSRDIARAETKAGFERLIGETYRSDAFGQMNLHPGTVNQALMELGAMVCVPNGSPHCSDCPWRESCIACRDRLTDQLPVKAPKKPRTVVDMTIFVMDLQEEALLIRRRTGKGVLKGLYELPNVEGTMTPMEAQWYLQAAIEQALMAETAAMPGAYAGGADPEIYDVKQFKHIFTHIEWHMTVYYVHLDVEGDGDWIRRLQIGTETSPMEAVQPEDLSQRITLPAAFAKVL